MDMDSMIDNVMPRLRPFTCKRMLERILELEFIVDYLYEALGPANDDIMDMANEAWEASRGAV